MATVTTAVTASVTPFPYSNIPAAEAQSSFLPRGETRLTSAFTIAAAGAGDNQALNLFGYLPPGYAYVVKDFGLRLFGVTTAANNWDTELGCVMSDGDSADSTYDVPIVLRNAGIALTTAVTGIRTYRMPTVPSLVVIPAGQSAVQLAISAYNSTANDQGYGGTLFVRAWQYEIEQAYDVAVNAALPVR